MSFFSSLAPILGTGLGALFAAPTGGMSMGMGALVGGLAGSSVGTAMSASEALAAGRSANQANVDMQRELNATEIELANTAHQREIADLRAAGLNPILSARLGGSATPSLQAPSVASLASTIQNSAQQSNDVLSSGSAAMNAFQLQRSQVALNSAQAVKAAADANASNTAAVGYALDNYRKGKNLPADVIEAANRQWEANARFTRPDHIKSLGLGLKDTVQSATGGLIGSLLGKF